MKFSELKANWAWFLKNMPDDEPCSFPRRETKKRIANKEKKSEVRFRCDPDTYSDFHTEKERIMRVLNENPTLFGVFLVTVLREWTEANVETWLAIHNGPDEPNADVPRAIIPGEE